LFKFATFQYIFFIFLLFRVILPLPQAIFSPILATDIHSETLLIADTAILADVADIQYLIHLLVEH